DELVTARQPRHRAVRARMRIPIEPKARLKIVDIALGYRGKYVTGIASGGLNDFLVCWHEAAEGISRNLITQPVAESEAVADCPFVLAIEKHVVPVVINDLVRSRQRLVD